MKRESIPTLVATHMTLTTDEQTFLCKALSTFHGTCEAEASTVKSDKTSFTKVKGESGKSVTGAQAVKRIVTDYGSSPLGLQLALLDGASQLATLSGGIS